MLEKKKLPEPVSTSLNELAKLITELEKNKEVVQELIKQSPDDLKSHRVYCAYTGKISDVLKLKIQMEKIDPSRLLSEALQAIAIYLAENNEISAAHYIGDHVEEIEEKVIQQWLKYQENEKINQNEPQKKELKKVSNLLEKEATSKKKGIKKKH